MGYRVQEVPQRKREIVFQPSVLCRCRLEATAAPTAASPPFSSTPTPSSAPTLLPSLNSSRNEQHDTLAGCKDSAEWTNNKGLSCSNYAQNGFCKDGGVAPGAEWTNTAEYNLPSAHCCVCGGGMMLHGTAAIPALDFVLKRVGANPSNPWLQRVRYPVCWHRAD